MDALEKALAARLRAVGFELEEQRFHPHGTLARLRRPGPLPNELPVERGVGEWRATEIRLIESHVFDHDHPARSGPRYEVRAVARLGEA